MAEELTNNNPDTQVGSGIIKEYIDTIDGAEVTEFVDGRIYRRNPDTGYWMKGTITKGYQGHKKLYDYATIACGVRDEEALRMVQRRLWKMISSKNDKTALEAIKELNQLEGWKNHKIQIDGNFNHSNMKDVLEDINKEFGIEDSDESK